jgi:hypothetical protein
MQGLFGTKEIFFAIAEYQGGENIPAPTEFINSDKLTN